MSFITLLVIVYRFFSKIDKIQLNKKNVTLNSNKQYWNLKISSEKSIEILLNTYMSKVKDKKLLVIIK